VGFLKKLVADFHGSRQAIKEEVDAQKQSKRRQLSTRQASPVAPSPSQIEFTVSTEIKKQPDRDQYAEPEDYDPLPILTLRDWDFGKGLNPTSDGFAFTAPDGKIWPAGKCQWSLWQELGVLAFNAVGEQYHLVDLRSPAFSPGQPVRLVAEPNNQHSETGNAISIRDLSMTKRAGYVVSGSASRLRNLLDGNAFFAMVLSADYEDARRTKRTDIKVVVFRPGRVLDAPLMDPHPPLADIADDSVIA
jgi:hypothetical protein